MSDITQVASKSETIIDRDSLNAESEGKVSDDRKEEELIDFIDRTTAYQIRPPLQDKFKSLTVKELIHNILNDELRGKVYSAEESEAWTKSIVGLVKDSVKQLKFKRYKVIVQTILGEHKGSGVKVGARCLWDADTDNIATDNFMNETLFCVVVVFGIYCY